MSRSHCLFAAVAKFGLMADAPSYESTLEFYKLKNTHMQVECTEQVISVVAKRMTRWRSVDLGIGTGAKDSIENDRSTDDEGKRRQYLERWREKYGHKATCERLARTFVKAERADLAGVVCEEHSKSLGELSSPHPMW